MDSLDFARMTAMSAVILAVAIGIALLIAIAGALLSPTVGVIGTALAALWARRTVKRRYAPRHAYNDRQAVAEGIRKGGRDYRLTGGQWVEVTA